MYKPYVAISSKYCASSIRIVVPSTSKIFTRLTDVSKHIIVVFESSISDSYHRDVYEELHNVIDKLSYDILHLTGKIPKVNLISHSRGGITSMMYTTGYREGSKTDLIKYEERGEGENKYLVEVEQPETYISNIIILISIIIVWCKSTQIKIL